MLKERYLTRRNFLTFSAEVGLGTATLATGCVPKPQETAPPPSPTAPLSLPTPKPEAAKAPQPFLGPVKDLAEPIRALEKTIPEEPLSEAEKASGFLWKRSLKENNLPKSPYTNERKTPYVYIGEKILATLLEGNVVLLDPKTGALEKDYKIKGAILGADENHAAVFSTPNEISIIDLKTRAKTGQIAWNPRLERKILWPAIVGDNVILIPEQKTILGTYDKISAYNPEGKLLWQTSDTENNFLLTTTDSQAITATEEEVVIRNINTGEIQTTAQGGAEIKKEKGLPWVFAIYKNYLFVATHTDKVFGERFPGQKLPKRVYLTVTNLETLEYGYTRIIPGFFDTKLYTGEKVCSSYCSHKFSNMEIAEHVGYDLDEKKDKIEESQNLLILLYGNAGTESYGVVFAIFSTKEKFFDEMEDFVLTSYLPAFNPVQMANGEKINLTYGEGDTTSQDDRMRTYRKYQNPQLRVELPPRLERTDKEVFLNRVGLSYSIPARRFAGISADNLIFANWTGKENPKKPVEKTLIAVNPEKDKEEPVWTRSLETTNPVQVVVQDSEIFVLGETLISINPQTGIPKLLNVMPLDLKVSKLWDNRDSLLAEAKNQLIAISTKPAI